MIEWYIIWSFVIKVGTHTILCVLYKNYSYVVWPFLYVLHIWCCSAGHKNIWYSGRCQVKLILSQPKLGFNIEVKKKKKHLSGRNLVLELLAFQPSVGKTIKLGNIKWQFYWVFYLNKPQVVLLSLLFIDCF